MVNWGFEDANEVVDASQDEIGLGGHRKVKMFGWEPAESVADASGVGVPNPDSVAAIVAESWANVPGIFAVGCPGATFVRLFMGNHVDARRGQGGCIIVKAAIEELMGREFRVESGTTEEIESGFGLG